MTSWQSRAASDLAGKTTHPKGARQPHQRLTPKCRCGYPLLVSDRVCPRCKVVPRWAK